MGNLIEQENKSLGTQSEMDIGGGDGPFGELDQSIYQFELASLVFR